MSSLLVRIAASTFAACGYAALLACTPSGNPDAAPASSPQALVAPAAMAAPAAAPAPAAIPEPAPATEPAVQAPVTKKKKVHKPGAAPVVAATAPAPPPAPVAAVSPPPVDQTPAPPPVCANCGVITAVTPVSVPGKGSGLGAVAGGVAGLVLGNQIGAGNGKTLAKIAGAAGGAYAGYKVEQKARATTQYQIRVHLDNGADTVLTQDSQPALPVGAAVRVVGGTVIGR